MTVPDQVLQRALDEAFVQHVVHLFSVLCSAPDPDEALKRFNVGFNKAMIVYEMILTKDTT